MAQSAVDTMNALLDEAIRRDITDAQDCLCGAPSLSRAPRTSVTTSSIEQSIDPDALESCSWGP